MLVRDRRAEKVGGRRRYDLDGTVAALPQRPACPKRCCGRRDPQGADYGNISYVEEKHIVYEQGLADDFHAIGIIRRSLTSGRRLDPEISR